MSGTTSPKLPPLEKYGREVTSLEVCPLWDRHHDCFAPAEMIKRHTEADGRAASNGVLLYRALPPCARAAVDKACHSQSKGLYAENGHTLVSDRIGTGFMPLLWFDSIPLACYIILWRGMQCNDACTGSCNTKTGLHCSGEMRRWLTILQYSL
jgi:hypothetical protein